MAGPFKIRIQEPISSCSCGGAVDLWITGGMRAFNLKCSKCPKNSGPLDYDINAAIRAWNTVAKAPSPPANVVEEKAEDPSDYGC